MVQKQVHELETKELFIRDPMTINIMSTEQKKLLQKCIEKSKKKRPLSKYNLFVKAELEKMLSDDMNPKDKIKIISDKWRLCNSKTP